MPRPLNLIIGEGTVKNQRMGGLGTIDWTSLDVNSSLPPISMNDPLDSSSYTVAPDFSTPLVPYSGSSGNNWLIISLLAAGVGFMILAKGRR
jgi:hypothetical protein